MNTKKLIVFFALMLSPAVAMAQGIVAPAMSPDAAAVQQKWQNMTPQQQAAEKAKMQSKLQAANSSVKQVTKRPKTTLHWNQMTPAQQAETRNQMQNYRAGLRPVTPKPQ
jgi:hypothetical protein